LYLTEEQDNKQYWNIPIANTTCILLGGGTSITQAAMRMLAQAGVLVMPLICKSLSLPQILFKKSMRLVWMVLAKFNRLSSSNQKPIHACTYSVKPQNSLESTTAPIWLMIFLIMAII
jgi:hypothetical protein